MHFLLLSLALLTTNASASLFRVPLRTTSSNPALTWHVSAFDIGCSPGGCVYSFDIYGVASENTPAFNTSCNGTIVEKNYVECRDKGVLSQLVAQQHPNWTVKAKHHWRHGAYADYYALGEVNVTAQTRGFEIPVGQVYGVA